MEPVQPTGIQLCGRLVVELRGRRIDASLPSRQGRLLFAYLTLNRDRPVARDELIEALWPQAMPTAAPAALTALLSKLRANVGAEVLRGRGDVTLALPEAARVDVEDAFAGVHEAESAVALGEWRRAWGPALRAQLIAGRRLLPEYETPWIDEWRRRLDDMLDHSLEAYAAACFGIGGTELPGAERAARRLVARAPLRESGYRLLMDTLAAQGMSERPCASTTQRAGRCARNLDWRRALRSRRRTPASWSRLRRHADPRDTETRRGRACGAFDTLEPAQRSAR